MPTFVVTGPDKKQYRVNTPEGSTREQAIAYVASTYYGEGGQSLSAIERIPVVGGLLGQIADYPAAFVEGLAGTGKSVVDVFGAGNVASEFLGDVSEGARELRSSESRASEQERAARSKAAEGKGTWEEVKAAAQNFLSAPLETTASVVGSALPYVGAVALAPETGGASLAALGALGTAAGVGTIKGDIYDAVYQRAREANVPEKQAQAMAEQAQAYGGENLDQISLGGAIGAVAGATGLPKPLANLIGRRAATEVISKQVERSALSRIGRGAVAEAVPEAVQAGQERFAQNIAQQRAGYDTDLWEGVAGQAAAEGIAGGVVGGGVGALSGRRARAPEPSDVQMGAEEAPTPEGLAPNINRVDPDATLSRLRSAAGEELSRNAEAAVTAVNRKVASDIARGTEEDIESSRAYIQKLIEDIDAGGQPEDVADALYRSVPSTEEGGKPVYTGALVEAQNMLNDVASVVKPTPAPEAVAEAEPVAAPTEGVATAEKVVSEPTAAIRATPFKPAPKWKVDLADAFADASSLEDYELARSGLAAFPEELSTEKQFGTLKSRTAGQQRNFERDIASPLIREINKSGLDWGEVATGLIAQQAPDRNRIVAERNPEFPEGGGVFTTAQAAEELQRLRDEGKLGKFNQIAKKVYDTVRFAQDKLVEGGLISREDMDAMRAEQPFYIPLSGHSESADLLETTTLDERDPEAINRKVEENRRKAQAAYASSAPMRTTKEFREAFGRSSMPFHPVFNVLEMAQNAVRRAEMNKAYRPVIRKWKLDPSQYDGLLHIYTDMNPKKVPTQKAGFGETYKPSSNMRATAREYGMHIAKDNGVPYYIEFANTPEGQALKRLFDNLEPEQIEGALKYVAAGNNFLKGMLTYKNPLHLMFVAPFRDISDAIATAANSQNIKGSPAYKKRLAQKTFKYAISPSTWSTLGRYFFGKEPSGNELDTQFRDMLDAGGAPLYARFENKQEKALETSVEFKKLKGETNLSPKEYALRLGRALNNWVDSLADIVDSSARFATYRAAIEEGIAPADAARLALDSSLNLTRRGAKARHIDLILPFFGAAVEGSRKTLRIANVFSTPKAASKVLGALIAYGVMESMWNSWWSDDNDDDGEKDYLDLDNGGGLRMSRAVIYYGSGSDDYIKVPVGQMLGYFKFIGNKIGDVMLGESSTAASSVQMADAAKELAVGLVGLLSPARISGGDLPSFASSFTPLVGKPFIENAFNQNYFGSPIYAESFPGGAPRSELGRQNTSDVWKGIAKTINYITGGSEAVSGTVDFQPEVYRHMIESYLGGPYQLTKQIMGIPEIEGAADVPGVRSFVGTGGKFAAQTKYFQNTDTTRQIMNRLNKLSPEQAAEQFERYATDTDPRVLQAYKATEAALDRINKQQKASFADPSLSQKDRKDLYDYFLSEKNRYYSAFNYVYNAAKSGGIEPE